MALLPLLFVLVQSLIQYPQPAGDGLDEATHRRMKERQELLDHQMARLLQELEQPDEGWGAVLFGALQQWPFWVLAGVLLLLGLCFSCRRRSHQDNSDDVNEGEERVDGQKEYTEVKVQESSAASEQRSREKEDRDGGNEESGSGGMKDREKTRDVGNEQGILLVDHIEWPVEDLERGCSVTAELMESLTRVFVDSVSHSFYPVPQETIRVGSAFEGWSPCDWDGVYHVLVPLSPPPGHAFHLELNSAGQVAARTFSVHVELVCTCKKVQLGEKPLCFLHQSRKGLRRKQKRSLLTTLCTDSYLDGGKTSHWFCQLVRSSWLQVPQWHSWHLVFQPCSRSCQLQLSKGRESLRVEMLFGVCQGDSDIFVVSQPVKANMIASTAWPTTYTVAEVKFFRHIARQLLCESLHLKCLQLFTCILRGTGFSSSTWKTVVMHVLTTVPLSRWNRSAFARRLWDIMAYLDHCLQLTRLEHFVLGNERLPAEISLPPAMRGVEPPNLFEHLARDPAALRAMQAYGQLRFRLWVLLSSH
ncbi:inositol 1,4,5-trisphosphate receptor-interacting protein-like 1 [Camarhynchus parvulus]|uniref:inositol 1,4,5-trisphosphate receptor-interacting protein-like 1 n=1 Tax=Geospiza parvula TaxID=87175 RepID=UPI001237C3C0|nr:inositol 1,4,5-trisphosphate receptor-interacting protein-like 1 [Camarhynchus parvulus]